MPNRKIWVKRPGASATMVSIQEDGLVDDARDSVLKKYANTLGRSFDAPDVTLRILPRDHPQRHSRDGERTLGPEEFISKALDSYFPGGQTVEEALIIDVPVKRTPRASPRNGHQLAHYPDETRPGDGGDYFPLMPAIPSPHLPPASLSSMAASQTSHHASVHSISVLSTGQVPSLPSPPSRARPHVRPRMGRTHATSPPIINNSIPSHLTTDPKQIPPAPPLPASPTVDMPLPIARAGTPPPARVASPGPKQLKKDKKPKAAHPELPAGALDGSVPPINVLIVEDNIINLKLLEAFMKRLKVRWQTAMNGREAVNKWRTGGFHLVLMDIQLPVMNGLDATKEIRRLERVNSIGVFSSSASSAPPELEQELEPEDKLLNTVLFKSPVIIVALTASSLQSDRHEALAAGCNDFLTKPVNFVWLERKVREWGCMQALIDFDGWRKWKDFSSTQSQDESLSSHSPSNARLGGGGGGASTAAGGGAGKGGTPARSQAKRDKSRAGTFSGAAAAAAAAPPPLAPSATAQLSPQVEHLEKIIAAGA